MELNPYKPPATPSEFGRSPESENVTENALVAPVLAYTANGNLEAHSVVTWLESNGIRAHVVEDNSGVSLFAFGTISQFHKPQVFVDKADVDRAGELLRQFETQRDQRRRELNDSTPITSECEECGASSEFPASQDGTTQNCPECNAFMDVGTIDWPDGFDFGDAATAPKTPDNIDDAIDDALKLDKTGDWDAAITAYQSVADRWPEHSTYIANCIADVRRKLDATR